MDVRQQELRFDWMQKSFSVDTSKRLPAFWIQDLLLLESLSDPAAHQIRHFRLHRGLNILWAKPFNPQATDQNSEESFSGHAAGKTLFCRMIRYLLGERHLGNEIVQEKVASNFPNGWVLGTVFIDETPWLVGRPFEGKRGQFSIEGTTVDEFLENPNASQNDFELFETTLNDRVMRDLKVREFPDRAGELKFQHLLPWLSRDQEARFGSAAHWREASSGAEPLLTDSEERSFLIRAVLDLIDPEEKKELDRNAHLVRERDALRVRLPVLEDRSKNDLARLQNGLKTAGLSEEFAESLSLEDDLLVLTVKSKLDEKLNGVRGLIEEIPSDKRVDELQSALTKSTEFRFGLERDWQALKTQLENLNTEWANFTQTRRTEKMETHVANLPMPPGRCGAPIDEHRGCQLWREWSTLPIDKTTGEIDLEAYNQDMGRRVGQFQGEVAAKAQEVETAKLSEESARRALRKANEQRHNLFAYLKTQEAAFQGLIGLAESAQTAHKEWLVGRTNLEEKDSAILQSYKNQQIIRDRQQGEFSRFSSYYEGICQHVLGKVVRGSVTTKKRLLNLELSDRGPLTSAAIETIKVLALDLAAVWYASERRGFHPGFLIHDGPREADMDAWLYRRFFTFVAALEAAYPAREESAFQYILTTTEPPPEELMDKQWLLDPTLSAQKASERLLKSDLR